MKVYKNFKPTKKQRGLKRSIVTMGTYDGVHIGHRHILKHLTTRAKRLGKLSVVVTFDRHPISVLNPVVTPRLITTLDEKLELFDSLGIDVTYVVPFTTQFSKINAECFIKEYLIDSVGMDYFIVGYDHGFGKDKEGTTDNLQKLSKRLNFKLTILKPKLYHGEIIKSSTIRSLLDKGTVDVVSYLLGKDYSFLGSVIKGQGMGKKIGIPTINIDMSSPEKIIPLAGIYMGWVEFGGKRRQAVMSIGPKPTFGIYEDFIEAHIIDFEGNLYGRKIRVGFSKRLRDIIQFNSPKELVRQIMKDIDEAKHNKFKKGVESTDGNHERTKV